MCSRRAFPALTDAVEKVGATLPTRNNRIAQAGFLNRSCAFAARLESILLEDPLKIVFRQYQSKCERLIKSKCFPLRPTKPTSPTAHSRFDCCRQIHSSSRPN